MLDTTPSFTPDQIDDARDKIQCGARLDSGEICTADPYTCYQTGYYLSWRCEGCAAKLNEYRPTPNVHRPIEALTGEALPQLKCGAKTKGGGVCDYPPAVHPITGFYISWRCRIHGGASTGPKVDSYGRRRPKNPFAGWDKEDIRAYKEAMDKDD